MSGESPFDRPATFAELAIFLDITRAELESFLRRNGIAPLCRAGRMRLYGPYQVRAVMTAAERESEEAAGPRLAAV